MEDNTSSTNEADLSVKERDEYIPTREMSRTSSKLQLDIINQIVEDANRPEQEEEGETQEEFPTEEGNDEEQVSQEEGKQKINLIPIVMFR